MRGGSRVPETPGLCKRGRHFHNQSSINFGVLRTLKPSCYPGEASWANLETSPGHLPRPRRRYRGNDALSRESYHNPSGLPAKSTIGTTPQLSAENSASLGPGWELGSVRCCLCTRLVVNANRSLTGTEEAKVVDWFIEWEKLEMSSRKSEIPREHFMQRWAQ